MGHRGPKPGTVKKTGGRKKGTPNKATAEIKALALRHGDAAIKELARIMNEADSDSARLGAIRELLDRGIGKAPQALAGPDKDGPTELVITWGGMRDAGDEA